jgi:hypothetical protein
MTSPTPREGWEERFEKFTVTSNAGTPILRYTDAAQIKSFISQELQRVREEEREANERCLSALQNMVDQFAYTGKKNGRLVMHTAGLSALEHAFSVLDLDDPTPIPEAECQEEGCHEEASTGTNTTYGKYMSLCFKHYQELGAPSVPYAPQKTQSN